MGAVRVSAQVAYEVASRVRDLSRQSVNQLDRVEDELGQSGPWIGRCSDRELAIGALLDAIDADRRSRLIQPTGSTRTAQTLVSGILATGS